MCARSRDFPSAKRSDMRVISLLPSASFGPKSSAAVVVPLLVVVVPLLVVVLLLLHGIGLWHRQSGYSFGSGCIEMHPRWRRGVTHPPRPRRSRANPDRDEMQAALEAAAVAKAALKKASEDARAAGKEARAAVKAILGTGAGQVEVEGEGEGEGETGTAEEDDSDRWEEDADARSPGAEAEDVDGARGDVAVPEMTEDAERMCGQKRKAEAEAEREGERRDSAGVSEQERWGGEMGGIGLGRGTGMGGALVASHLEHGLTVARHEATA